MPTIVRTMNPKDIDQVLALAKKAKMKDEKPDGFLNIVYERDGDIWAWASVRKIGDDVVVAPVVASRKMKGRAMIRLFEFGEKLLWVVDVRSYIFSIHIKRKKYRDFMERTGIFEKIGAVGTHIWYRRNLI